MSSLILWYQRRANPNPDLDLNPDLATFPNPVDLDLKIFGGVDLDLSFERFGKSGFGFGFGFEGSTGFGFEVAWICPPLGVTVAIFDFVWWLGYILWGYILTIFMNYLCATYFSEF